MSFKVIFGVFICGIYLCSGSPVRVKSVTVGDDKANWKAMWKAMQNSNNGRSGDESDENIFDKIVGVNAKERGSGSATARSGDLQQEFLYEGDIVMKKSDVEDMMQENGTSRQRRAVIETNSRFLWSRNVSYAISEDLFEHTDVIKGAVKEFEDTLNCLGTWRDVSSVRSGNRPSDYMYFIQGNGCYSRIGKVGGRQEISIGSGCQFHGIVVHEIGHAMGLWHEQSRPDRDEYVDILFQNIIPGMEFNFNKQPSSRINSFGVGYDYGSVMHYGERAFSRNGSPTIRSKQAGAQLGQRRGLSAKDKLQLQQRYGCTTNPTVQTTVQTTVEPTQPSGCQANVRSDYLCNNWKSRGFCQLAIYMRYMATNCCKACGVGVPVNCVDKNTSGNCPKWASYGFCASSSQFHAYMKTNCSKSCGCI